MSVVSISRSNHVHNRKVNHIKRCNTSDSSLSFKGVDVAAVYDTHYKLIPYYNGVGPDRKVIDILRRFFPEPDGVTIADIGAGDGRNSIPLAKKGYNVFAYDLSSSARKIMDMRRSRDGLAKNLTTRADNILNGPLSVKSDGILMSHLTQHFTVQELESAMTNLARSVKQGGILIFDALINKGNAKSSSALDAPRGYSFFDLKHIAELAKTEGFEVLEVSDYDEKGPSRPYYIDTKTWGGEGAKWPIKESGIGKLWILLNDLSEFCTRKRKVDLKWFVLRKI